METTSGKPLLARYEITRLLPSISVASKEPNGAVDNAAQSGVSR